MKRLSSCPIRSSLRVIYPGPMPQTESPTALPSGFAPDAELLPTVRFLERVFPPPRRFHLRLWDGSVLPAHGPADFTLVLNSPGTLRRSFLPPVEDRLGEAFLRGEVEVEGDLEPVFSVVDACRAAVSSPRKVLALARLWRDLPDDGEQAVSENGRAPAELHGELHSPERDQEAIQYHYDVGNDFYRLFLDRRMIYSCAYFPTGTEDLDTAQGCKLELICRKLRLQPGERLLDIGCGWGGLILYAARHFGVRAVGVTLSEEQQRLATERIRAAGLSDRVEARLLDYRELADGPFDKVASVGMFEHVGRERAPEYFEHVYRLTRPGGLFLNHAIANQPPEPRGVGGIAREALNRAVVGRYSFRKRYIFPDGELVPVSEANLAAERAGWEVRDVENLREHYAKTVRHWMRRLAEHQEEAERIAGPMLYRAWRLYLSVSAFQFTDARIAIHQTLLARPTPEGSVELPPTRADLYAA